MAPALIAFDGWSLAYAPFSPAAIHLLTLLADDSSVDPFLVLLPAPTPHPLPERPRGRTFFEIHPCRSHLSWEQARLPQLAARAGAAALHLVTPTPALFARIPQTCSPACWNRAPGPPAGGLSERLRRSLAAGGLANLRRLDWPADLPDPQVSIPLARHAPRVHPLFWAASPLPPQPAWPALDLAGAPFSLYAGPSDPGSLSLLLAGWSWAAPALGDDFRLVLPNLPAPAQKWVAELAAGQPFAPSLTPLQTAALPDLAWLYRQAALVIQLAPGQPWGDPVSLALAAGRPLVAPEDALTAARAGPAAFLTPAQDARLLGAALVTLGSDEALAGALMEAAIQRSANWV